VNRYLIVANQTLGGEELDRTVRDRIERGDSHFHVLVPMTPPHHETEWSGGFVAYEGMSADEARQWFEQDSERRTAMMEAARSLAEQRLTQMTEMIESAGGRAEGTVCDADPLVAIKDVVSHESFDEVIISTLPSRFSRWIRMDVPSRVARVAGAPVTTIEAQE
jgi:nucleotide-binding universal stress UspA family protein